ncbi:MAG TPA: bifunctional glycosyltransferase/class I SAM-dependent methyltransferase [Acidimicrobiales bacterium]|nr:bifunctional glycosyltransferase/class I SAM-dependent methyltransferase [Acidimicrobiales bacterium]
MDGSVNKKKIGVLVVAYNAAGTLAKVLDRIPTEIRPDIEEVIVADDHSQDATYLVGLGYQQLSDLPITVIRQPTNLGYGGNQKAGYNLAIEHGLDIVVMLHGDGQYAPESLPDILAPLVAEEDDAVFGSRIMIKGAARKGGMPLYKFAGNRILTRFENAALGTHLSEFHSGYRAYSVAALKQLPYEKNSDGFNFDTQIIIQLQDAGMRIAEVPIPTYYGDEICYVDGLGYAADVTRDVITYRLQKAGFGDGSRIALPAEYQLKPSEDSSHGRISSLLHCRPPSRILDLGCSSGLLSERLKRMGHHVTGVDVNEIEEVTERTNAFVRADLNEGIPSEVGTGFDIVLAADVLEHVVNPGVLLSQVRDVLAPNGTALFCVPNIAHWYPRFRSTFGMFGYDQRGILDSTHLRFFTRRSLAKLVERREFAIRRIEPVGVPLDALGVDGTKARTLRLADRLLSNLWPTMFAYQFIVEATPVRT